MKLLAIESSCDDFAIAIFDTKLQLILESCVLSQNHKHGIIPECAARSHAQLPWAKLTEIFVKYKIDKVAVTAGPGLMGSLQVGVIIAKTIASFYKIPLIAINHIDAHILTPVWACNLLHQDFLSIVISGGHSLRAYVDKDRNILDLHNTLDDAAGDAIDKVARAFGIIQNEGPNLEKLALKGLPIYYIPKPKIFSFSGVKSYIFGKNPLKSEYANWAASLFVTIAEIVFEQILIGIKRASRFNNIKYVGISGGVAANNIIRNIITSKCRIYRIIPVFPKKNICTDNAEMIAWLANLNFSNKNDLLTVKCCANYSEMVNWRATY